MHSRDITILLFCSGLILCTTPACFSTFYESTIVPTLVENAQFFVLLFTFLLQIIMLTGGPMHFASIGNNGAARPTL